MKAIKGHQGDVQFQYVDQLPAKAIKIANRPIAYGEHSGHQHVITGDVEMFEFEGQIYTVIGKDGASLQHCHESDFSVEDYSKKTLVKKADHEAHTMPSGIVAFFIQNAFNPYSKLMEKVID